MLCTLYAQVQNLRRKQMILILAKVVAICEDAIIPIVGFSDFFINEGLSPRVKTRHNLLLLQHFENYESNINNILHNIIKK